MTEPNELELTVKLESFEGPLDLLLHLIKEMKIDIFDIPIAEVTSQYLRHLDSMQKLKLDVAGDYLLMAATLLEIKSRMLLPPKEYETDENFYEEGEDPREELVRQLVEYQHIQEAAKTLKELENERGQYYTKAATDLEALQQSIPLIPGEVTTADLLLALQKMFRKLERKKPLQARIENDQLTVEETMRKIMCRFDAAEIAGQRIIPFTAFFERPSRTYIVNTFLAMLELVKERKIVFIQDALYSDISLTRFMGAGENVQ